MNTSIFIGGVGGQGLVLMTKILSEACFNAGYDVKTNDVVGLSQRGGKIYGTVKFGKKVYSPNIIPGFADFVIGLEPLEAYRWSYYLKEDTGISITNTHRIYPTMVTMEQMEYPEDIEPKLKQKGQAILFDATEIARESGNPKMSNTVLIGLLTKLMDFDKNIMIDSIKSNVPAKGIDLNIMAFEKGYNFQIET